MIDPVSREINVEHSLLESLFSRPVRRQVLDNGLTVVTRPDSSAELVSVQVWVKTGSIHEGAWTGAGLSHFLEHMLFKGTVRRGPLDISREVHAIGGYINAYTSYDRTVYYIDAPVEQAEKVFDILADMTLAARIPEEDFASERDVILREIDMGMDDPDRQLFYAFARNAFRQHPYRFPVIGLKPLFARVGRDDLYQYYTDRYQPGNMTLVVVGALPPEQVISLADATFGQAPPGLGGQPVIVAEPPQLAARREELTGDVNIVRGMAGYKVPGLSDPCAPSLDMLAFILGHGKSSLLWRRLREELKLVQHVDASCWNPGDQGLLWLSYTCAPGQGTAVDEALQQILAKELAGAVTAEALGKAVRQAIVGEINGRKTMAGQASRLGVAEVVVGELDYPRQYFNLLARLRPDDLLEAAGRFITDRNRTAVSLEPPASEPCDAPHVLTVKGLPDFAETAFGNGVRLLFQHDEALPKVHLRLVMKGGPGYDPVDAPGTGGVLASLLTRDTETREAAQLAAEVDRVGGTFSEFIGNNTFGLSAEVLPQDFALAAGWVGDALLRLHPVETSFAIEREAQLASFLEDEDEILDYGRRRLRRRFFGEHAFAHDYLGTREGLEAMTLAHVESLRALLVTGPNAVLAVSGAVDNAAVQQALGPILEKLPGSAPMALADLPRLPAETGDVIERLPREQAVVLEAYPDVGACDEDFIVGELLDELLSGMSSHLFEAVREMAGLAYYVGSSRSPGLDAGMFLLYAGTYPDAVAAVQEEFVKEIERICSGGVSEEELAACRTRLKIQKRQGQQAIGARAMQAALNVHYGQPVNTWRDYPERLEAVSHERLTAFARTRFDPGKRLRLVVRPNE